MGMITKQFISFGIIGVGNTVVDFTVYALLTRLLLVPTLVAFTIGFITANVQSYILNSRFTFSHAQTNKHHSRFIKFLGVSTISWALNLCVFSLLHYSLGWHDLISKVIATGVIVIVSFVLQRVLTFNTVS